MNFIRSSKFYICGYIIAVDKFARVLILSNIILCTYTAITVFHMLTKRRQQDESLFSERR